MTLYRYNNGFDKPMLSIRIEQAKNQKHLAEIAIHKLETKLLEDRRS